MELFCKKIIFQFLGFSQAQQGPQVLPQPSPPSSPSDVSSVKVSREVQTSPTWLNKTPLRVPEWHPPKKDRETQTFCS